MKHLLHTLLIVVAVGLVGCGGPNDAPTRVTVTGEVTFDGKPLSKGDIIFRPEEGNFADAGKIADGKYEMEVVPGKYRVEITSLQEVPGTAKTLASGESGAEMEQVIPEKYNGKSELSAEVSESGENKFDFKLEK